jgi:Kdo2-lipid IVA lauroyltransferase/acyltransferase
MIRPYLLRLLAKVVLAFGFHYNGVQHKFYAFLLSSIVKYRKKTITHNLLRSFPHSNRDTIDRLVADFYHRLAYYVLQSICCYFGKKEEIKKKLVVNNADLIKKSLSENHNVIFLSAHYGNWELISMLLPTYFTCPVIGVYKPLSSTVLEVELKKWRSRFGLTMVPMKEMIPWFSNKDNIPFITLLLADQSPPKHEAGEVIHFLNQKTMFYNGANVLKKRYNPKIFYQKTSVIDDVHYIDFIELSETNVIQQYASLLEKDINLDPSLWVWSHNRWKHNL